MPRNTVSVTRPGMWGNHVAKRKGITDRLLATMEFEHWLCTEASWAWRETMRKELRGKNLACFCPLTGPCHADVLLKYANSFGNGQSQTPPTK